MKTCQKCKGAGEIIIKKSNGATFMNSGLDKMQIDINEAVQVDAAKDDALAAKESTIADQKRQIDVLQARVDELLKATRAVTLTDIQAITPETLWYEARSAGAPKSGPHGTITVTPGKPATADFHPVNLGGQSDNCYLLARLYDTLTDAQKALMETASKFTLGCTVALDPLPNVQAFELDYQIRKSNGVVINIGLQLLRDGTLRGFDYVKKAWVPLGAKTPLATATPIAIGVEATCDDKTVQFTQVIVNGAATPVSVSHPTSMSTPGKPYLNVAYQLDGTSDAKAYKATVGELAVTFS